MRPKGVLMGQSETPALRALERAYEWLAEIAVLGPIYGRQPEKAMRLAAMRGRDEAYQALATLRGRNAT
jgi:hypothetical protein